MRLRYGFFCLILPLLFTVMIGCGGGSSSNSGSKTASNSGSKTVTANISSSSSSITAGSQATLTWSTTNATSVSIDQGIGTVAASGTQTVSPTQTTTYTLTATGGSQTVTSTVTVTVTGATAAPTVQFSASPTTVQAGQSATLTWSTTNATSVSIDQGIGTVAASGTQSVSPTQTTTYTLTATGGGQTVTGTATVTVGAATAFTGVLGWKGSTQGDGLYDNETTLTPANVNSTQFGEVRKLAGDGALSAQPLYVQNVNLGAQGTHDLLIVASENDSVYAFDGKGTSTTPLWHRNFVVDANGGNANCTASTCVTTAPDTYQVFGGQIGITGTPVVDPQTGILYVVAATQQNGTVSHTVHAIDIRTGDDATNGSAVISGTVPGTGLSSVNGQIAFQPAQQNQRPGLVLNNGVLYIVYGSFDDNLPYQGWVFAYDPATLKQLGAFNSDPNGSGASFWASGAPPSFESDGTFFIVGANGVTDAQGGGVDYGETVLHMSFTNGQFKVLDWFVPFNFECLNRTDLEIGSGSVALLPSEVGSGRNLAVMTSKEGRLYLLDRANLGQFNSTTDQVVQEFMVSPTSCTSSTTGDASDGTGWQRLYGNVSYWNGNLYMAASNAPIEQFSISGTAIDTTPAAVGVGSLAATYVRGGNTVVSANGNTNGIVWMYAKTQNGNAIMHAYDAADVGTELWNSQMDASRDALNTGGEAFQAPVVIDGMVFATSGYDVNEYSLLP